MKIIHDPDTLKETFKNAILRNDCIKIAVFLFEPKILSDICGMEKDDFYEMLKSKLECLYIDNEETLEAVKELINELPVHYIESPSKIFHPKVFFFSNSKSNDWEAIISSANITYGLAHDIQSSAHLTNEDDKGNKFRSSIEDYFNYLMLIEKKPNKEETMAGFNDSMKFFLESIEPYLDDTFTSDRLWLIMKRALQGESYKDIGKDKGITGEYARQLTIKGMKRLNSISKTMKMEENENFLSIQKAYKGLISSYAYVAAKERYPSCMFFKPRLNLLGRLKKTMAY